MCQKIDKDKEDKTLEEIKEILYLIALDVRSLKNDIVGED